MVESHVVALTSRSRILVAEDDRVLQDMVAEMLVEAGYEVTTASDGDEALRVAREYAPDLVLLDITMPRMDGYAVCREIQSSFPIAPAVIFLTAHGTVEDRVAGLDLGAVDYLVKPFKPPELEARVRAALRTRATVDARTDAPPSDPLTGLLNRRQIESRAADAVALARSQGRPLACLLLGIDQFQEAHDAFGYQAGHAVLREVARRVQGTSRRTDVLARFGQQELLLLLPEADGHGAVVAAERIRRHVASLPVELPLPAPPLQVTATIGVAALSPAMPDATALFQAAGQALAQGKEEGGDRVTRLP